MKLIIRIVRITVIILLILCTLFWIMAHGSGHNIPIKTDKTVGLTIAVLLVLLLIFNFLEKRILFSNKKIK